MKKSTHLPTALIIRFLVVGSVWAGAALTAAETPAALVGRPLAARTAPRGKTLFHPMTPAETGIVTENKYADPRMWGERYAAFEVGAVGTGVAIGDYDGDGRPDIFVVSKTESCRLFRNLGDWKFEDVTKKAGVGDEGADAAVWKQGATFVDVNNDGRLDLYVCRFAAPNLLYINQGDGTFKEEAAARGLAVNDSSAMAAFCDYDHDGWLDVFVLTNILDPNTRPTGQRPYLFHNDGKGGFVDVTASAGIRCEGQGHSATWWDYDGDGWPDLYVAYDFAGPDALYRNRHDGTFENVIDTAVPHTTLSSMGADIGDVNNDGRMDLLVADMAATTHQKDQRTMAQMRSLATDPADGATTAPQYPHSALFLGTDTGRCLEAAWLAGLAATDWTWAPRFEDLDEDGRVDLFVTTGMHRESHNVDLMARMRLAESTAQKIQIEKAGPVFAEPNLAYHNVGDLRFEDVSAAWGLDERGVSFGAAFGDLDGDGDLDLVYANYQKGVTVLRNDTEGRHHVLFDLRGTRSNRFGVGATVRIRTDNGIQVRQLALARGVLSSSEPVVHFGLGDAQKISEVEVTWPSGAVQVFHDVAADQRYAITEPVDAKANAATARKEVVPRFIEVSNEVGLSIVARESKIDELDQQPLLPRRFNRNGPPLAVGDLTGAGHPELVIGGTTVDPLRVAAAHGSRYEVSPLSARSDQALNDGPLVVFDANGDGYNDLLVTKSGVARPAGATEYQPQLWLNDGHGNFSVVANGVLPELRVSAGAAVAADFDHDGKVDLMIGGRIVPGAYPRPARSALWLNRGGRFEDVTDQIAPALHELGMVTAAVAIDVDNDGWVDLVIATDWGRVHCLHNDAGKAFSDWSDRLGFSAAGAGWWTSLASADFNGDGRPDFVVGNLGLNTPYRADAQHPVLLYAGDFNGDGGEQLVEAYDEGDRTYPRRGRRDLGAAIPGIMKRFPKNDAYARATLAEIVGEQKLTAADRYAATELQSGVFLSGRDGSYTFSPLPRVAQISPIQAMVVGDFDGDGIADIYAVQNSYAPVPSVGRFDGGLSVLLHGDGHGGFMAVPPAESGLIVPGDAKSVAKLPLGATDEFSLVVTRNNAATLVFRKNPKFYRSIP